MEPASFPGPLRRALASLIALGYAAGVTYVLLGDRPENRLAYLVVAAIPIAVLLLGAGLLHHRHLGSQILTRAIFWAHLLFVTLVALFAEGAHERGAAAAFVAAASAVLLLLGPQGLLGTDPRSPFSPVAFRASLTGLLVMALADAQTLLFYGAANVENRRGALPLLCALGLIVAMVGLYRLRVWGLLLGMLTNAVTVWVALTGRLDLPGPLPWAVALTALIQIALPLPLLVSVLRRRPVPAPAPSRAWGRVTTAAILCLLGLSIFSAAAWHPPLPRAPGHAAIE